MAREILKQTDGKMDVFLASVGIGDTLLGVAQAQKGHDTVIKVVGVEFAGSRMMGAPENYPLIPGIPDGIIPDIWASGLVDRVIDITDEEAIRYAHEIA